MFRLTVLFLILFTAACAPNLDESQGHTNRQDIMNMGLEENPQTNPTNPRSIERVGETWGDKQMRDQMRDAAHTVPGVHVERIIMDGDRAWVTVSLAGDLTEDEQKAVKEEVTNQIKNSVPDYNVTVKSKS
ncbi:YhcN/YlaJ family sporulation lipoprotein [Halobacillus sp. A1]|uniref:YhcN/YlaJ family sporulation lipoprotein n=1 Tax=Halobacillus sp. A1 TaxID=2880262 RepID=UPI0020A6D217|nr:YhcN/YlaJ family sporulation lipoprotein [Halobacillus sp. A1]